MRASWEWEWKWPPAPLSYRAVLHIAARQMETMSVEAIHTFCQRGRKETIYIIFTRMIWKTFSQKLEGPSKPCFQTLVFFTVKDILQFPDSSILSWLFPHEIFSVVAWLWGESQNRCAFEINLFCFVALEDTVVAYYLATVKNIDMGKSSSPSHSQCRLAFCSAFPSALSSLFLNGLSDENFCRGEFTGRPLSSNTAFDR